MSLGETICRLRGEKHMSQGELADALGVSRQSVSKWETDGSVPELEKLVKLSGVFGVTLDELVSGEKPAPTAPTVEQAQPPRSSFPPRKVAGTVLLCMSFLVTLFLTVMGSLLMGLILASPLLLSGAICFLFRRRVGLWCAWAVYFTADLYFRWATGINIWLVRYTPVFTPEMNYVRLIFAWANLLCLLLLILLTALSFRKEPLAPTRRGTVLFVVGWVLLFLIRIPSLELSMELLWLYGVLQTAVDWVRIPLLTALLVAAVRVRKGRRKHEN